MRKTKIVCTLGPASSTEEVMEQMFKAGMNIGRLNFSHGTHESHGEMIDRFRAVRDRLGISAAVLLDTKGPEIRLEQVEEGTELKEGSEFILTTETVMGNSKKSSVTYKNMPSVLKTGDTVLIDDGLIKLTVNSISGNDIYTTVVTGGPISSNKGVNLPKIAVDMPFMSDRDRSDVLFGIEKDVDFIAASFVRSREDVIELRTFLNEHGGSDIKIISKIENQQGVDNFDDILEFSDGIMVARGDMAVEVDYELLPGLQKSFIHKCVQAGKMVICATQMLESMTYNSSPTRAEITDVANAVFDGTSAVMTSGETTKGAHPVLVVETMARIARQAEKDAALMDTYRVTKFETNHRDRTNAICDAACTTARDLNAAAIIAVTKSGSTARNISKFRPATTIIAATTEKKTFHQLALSWGVFPVMSYVQTEPDTLFSHALDCAVKTGLVHKGDCVVITAGIPLNISGMTNVLTVEYVD